MHYSYGMSPVICIFALLATAQNDRPVIQLWPSGAPGSESRKKEAETKPNPWSVGNIYNPSLTVYQPAPGTANGTAVIIAPGGGHRELVVGEEGYKPAEFLSKQGITAFVLKYRLAREKDSGLTIDKDTRADAYRAVRLVRSRAKQWNLSPDRIGMLGFSAGGEVLSMAAFDGGPGEASASETIDRENAKPNFGIWIYSGPVGIPAEVPANSPPAFILVATDDGAANVAIDLTQKYRKAKVPVELHILSGGGHGFNMGDRSKLTVVNTWPQRLLDWMGDRGYLKKG